MENQRKKKSSRGAIAAGVFIALYLVTYFIIGAICMPVAVLFLIMPEVVAFFCSAYIPHDADKIPRLGADFYSRVTAQPASDCQPPYSHCAGCFHSSRYRCCSDCKTRQL